MDEVAQAVAKLKKEWDQALVQIQDHIRSIEKSGTSGRGTEDASSFPRLNGAAQDGLAVLRSLQFRLDFLAQQCSTEEEAQSAQLTLEFWKEQYQNLHQSLKNANLQAKSNIRKAALEERELLLGGGEDSTICWRNLQTKVGMTSAAESITESLRCTRQLMVQEAERSANTLATFGKFLFFFSGFNICYKSPGYLKIGSTIRICAYAFLLIVYGVDFGFLYFIVVCLRL